MRRKKEVTMQFIADQLGISKVTVSKALKGQDGVSEELRKKIKEVATTLATSCIFHATVFLDQALLSLIYNLDKFIFSILFQTGDFLFINNITPILGSGQIR